MPTMNTAKYDAESDLPNLEQHNNHMAHVLTLDLYNSLRGKMTPSGFTVDHAIQTGVDNPGNFNFNRIKKIDKFFNLTPSDLTDAIYSHNICDISYGIYHIHRSVYQKSLWRTKLVTNGHLQGFLYVENWSETSDTGKTWFYSRLGCHQ